MRICTNCGTENDSVAIHCSKCSQPLELTQAVAEVNKEPINWSYIISRSIIALFVSVLLFGTLGFFMPRLKPVVSTEKQDDFSQTFKQQALNKKSAEIAYTREQLDAVLKKEFGTFSSTTDDYMTFYPNDICLRQMDETSAEIILTGKIAKVLPVSAKIDIEFTFNVKEPIKITSKSIGLIPMPKSIFEEVITKAKKNFYLKSFCNKLAKISIKNKKILLTTK